MHLFIFYFTKKGKFDGSIFDVNEKLDEINSMNKTIENNLMNMETLNQTVEDNILGLKVLNGTMGKCKNHGEL